jgi:hypothetical protein
MGDGKKEWNFSIDMMRVKVQNETRNGTVVEIILSKVIDN